MDSHKIQELLKARALAEEELEKMRARVTILFSDIKGSTAYFEQKGDLEGLSMVRHVNSLLCPVIETTGGRVVKTIGDAIMAAFEDPVNAIRASIGMQQVLESDRVGRAVDDQTHIRIGLHTGLGLVDHNDVYGDVVNAASRVQHLAEPDQILITDVLLDAATTAGVQCAKVGRAEMKGKDEPIEVYAVAWSVSASMQLMEDLHADFERKLKEAKRQQERIEEEFEGERDHWRAERRRLVSEIERLEEKIDEAAESALHQVNEDLHAEIRFQLQEALRAREQVEQELVALQAKWDIERTKLKGQLTSMETTTLETIERTNNPTRFALVVREEVDVRIKEARSDWELQWEGERRRLQAEIERLRNVTRTGDPKKEAARRKILERLGKVVPTEDAGPKTPEQYENEFQSARMQWETERGELSLKVNKLEREADRAKTDIRREILQDLRSQYESKLNQALGDRSRLEEQLQAMTAQFDEERQRSQSRIDQLEQSIAQVQEAVRRQVTAELKAEFDDSVGELTRVKTRAERRLQDSAEEWESERRRLRRLNTTLEEQLKEAKQDAFKAQRMIQPAPAE
jgi:class 3 adenylate cyclase